jgi:hypothetical protein
MKRSAATTTAPVRFAPLLILLTAVCLRLFALTDVPPGLTHDEAGHGVTAWAIVNGAREIYFTIGYGREPLYDYLTAGLMTFLGPTYLAGRLTAVYFSLFTVAGLYAWVRRAFDRPTALLTAAGLAVSFWPLMTARQSLRSTLLPALFVLALALFWRALQTTQRHSAFRIPHSALAGLLLGLTWYTYIPARALWGVFPALLGYWLLRQRPLLRQAGWRALLMLLVMFAVAAPLLLYLRAHAGVEVRIAELSAPLTAALNGDFTPLLRNAWAGLRTLSLEGDPTWRYNLPGRPFLPPLMSLLFYPGLLLSLWRLLAPSPPRPSPPRPLAPSPPRPSPLAPSAHLLALAWLLLGLAPVLVTGPEWSVTQAIGMQPVVYLFPALALRRLGDVRLGGRRLGQRRLAWAAAAGLFAITAVSSARAYFVTWANHPQVRVQYESTLVAAMDYLNAHGTGATAVSTITPGPYHSPALAQMTLRNPAVSLRWFDARDSLLLPAAPRSQVLLPGFTPLSPALEAYFAPAALAATLPLRPDDLDRPLRVYDISTAQMRAAWQAQLTPAPAPVDFGDAVTFLGYELQTPRARPGETVRLVTLWQAERPLPDLVLFTHLLGPDGAPLAQADRLGAPSALWRAGDWFMQLHEFTLPAETAVGAYPLAVGVYTQTAAGAGLVWPSRRPTRRRTASP